MAKQIEVFFDYVCPFCDKGIRQFLEILPDHPDVEIVWRPCESHPRPEHASVHSDLAIQGMYYLRDIGGDLTKYHLLVFDAVFQDRKRADDIGLLADLIAACGGDRDEARKVLEEGRYAREVEEGNDYAWEEQGLYAVPSYISGDERALSRNGILVPIRKVKAMLAD